MYVFKVQFNFNEEQVKGLASLIKQNSKPSTLSNSILLKGVDYGVVQVTKLVKHNLR